MASKGKPTTKTVNPPRQPGGDLLHFLDRLSHTLREIHDKCHGHPGLSTETLFLVDVIMATAADLDSKLDQISAKVDDLKAQIAALQNQPPPVVTQEQADALAAKEDAILAK